MIRLKIGEHRINAEHIAGIDKHATKESVYYIVMDCAGEDAPMPLVYKVEGDEATAFLWWWDKWYGTKFTYCIDVMKMWEDRNNVIDVEDVDFDMENAAGIDDEECR